MNIDERPGESSSHFLGDGVRYGVKAVTTSMIGRT
jgi:hypothetical protein